MLSRRAIRSSLRYVILYPFSSSFKRLQLIQANARSTSFRNIIANVALAKVQSFLQKYGPERIEEHVKAGLIYYGEIPFLYRVFKPTDIPAPKSKERGGYKVVSGSCLVGQNLVSLPFQTRQGLFQYQPILETMLNYYGKRGIKQYLPTKSSRGNNPIGMLALVCTAVRSLQRL